MTNYRAGIVGLGGIGAGPLAAQPVHPALGIRWPHPHAGAYAVQSNVEVVAVCDLVPELLDQFRTTWHDTWPDVTTYTDYREMLDDEQLDLLSVVTSDHRHAQISIDAAERGVRGIFCEKPIATTMAEADQMIAACQKNGAVMTVDHSRRWMANFHAAMALLGDGPLGAVRRIVGSMGGPRAMLFRNGTHLIDTVCWFANSEPEWVIGQLDAGHENHPPRYAGDGGKDSALDPAGSGLVQFANGVRGFINCHKEMATPNHVYVFAEHGRLLVDNNTAEAFIVGENRNDVLRRVLPVPHTQRGDTPAAIAELIEAIEQGGIETISPPQEARKTLGIMLGMLQSNAADSAKVRFPVQDV
ncbi:MAG: hypothetical protein CL878_12260 [Dehalococcoidia bacterium]|nr:hypothetical protein [Dehalococcoidia bacterium]